MYVDVVQSCLALMFVSHVSGHQTCGSSLFMAALVCLQKRGRFCNRSTVGSEPGLFLLPSLNPLALPVVVVVVVVVVVAVVNSPVDGPVVVVHVLALFTGSGRSS